MVRFALAGMGLLSLFGVAEAASFCNVSGRDYNGMVRGYCRFDESVQARWGSPYLSVEVRGLDRYEQVGVFSQELPRVYRPDPYGPPVFVEYNGYSYGRIVGEMRFAEYIDSRNIEIVATIDNQTTLVLFRGSVNGGYYPPEPPPPPHPYPQPHPNPHPGPGPNPFPVPHPGPGPNPFPVPHPGPGPIEPVPHPGPGPRPFPVPHIVEPSDAMAVELLGVEPSEQRCGDGVICKK